MSKNFFDSVVILNIFLKTLDQKGVAYDTNVSPHNKDIIEYVINYQDFMVSFFHEVSDIPISFIRQFISLHKLNSIVSNLEQELTLNINIFKDHFDLRLIKFGGHRHDSIITLNSYVSNDSSIYCTYREVKITPYFSYDDAYNMILNELCHKISPDLMNSSLFLKLYDKTDKEVIQQKSKLFNHNYISHDEFCNINGLVKKRKMITVEKTTFIKFLKDSFFIDSYHKLLQITSLTEFYFDISGEDKKSSISIHFPTVSRFLVCNTLVSLNFFNFTIMFDDHGNFSYENMATLEAFYDLDLIYNYILKDIMTKISCKIETPTEQLTFRDIEMYKMVTY